MASCIEGEGKREKRDIEEEKEKGKDREKRATTFWLRQRPQLNWRAVSQVTALRHIRQVKHTQHASYFQHSQGIGIALSRKK